MWENYQGILIRVPISRYSLYGKKFFVFCLDNEIIWNPYGERLPRSGYGSGWIWGLPNEEYLVRYINNIFSLGIIPVFYSNVYSSSLKEICEEIISQLEFEPYFYLEVSKDRVLNILEGFGSAIAFSDITMKEFGFDPIIDIVDKYSDCMLILVGQQASLREDISEELKSKEFEIIGPKEVEAIKRRSSVFLEKLYDLINKLKNKTIKGIVINSANPRLKERELFIDICKENSLKYYTGWISKPGFERNKSKKSPIPETVLDIYNKKFEHFSREEHPIRII